MFKSETTQRTIKENKKKQCITEYMQEFVIERSFIPNTNRSDLVYSF